MVEPPLHHFRSAARRARRLTGTTLEVEDLEQESALAWLLARQTHDPARGVPLNAYAWQRVQWAAVDAARRWGRPHGHLESEQPPDPEQLATRSELQARLATELAALPEPERRALLGESDRSPSWSWRLASRATERLRRRVVR